MRLKKPRKVKNPAGGYDLMVERDFAGNDVRVLTGGLQNSLEFWKDLAELALTTVGELQGERNIEIDKLVSRMVSAEGFPEPKK